MTLENQVGVISFHTSRKIQLKNVIWAQNPKEWIEPAGKISEMFRDMKNLSAFHGNITRNQGNRSSRHFYQMPNKRYLVLL
jgi:hypothetical protein